MMSTQLVPLTLATSRLPIWMESEVDLAVIWMEKRDGSVGSAVRMVS